MVIKQSMHGIYKMKSLLRFSEPKEVNGTAFLTWDDQKEMRYKSIVKNISS